MPNNNCDFLRLLIKEQHVALEGAWPHRRLLGTKERCAVDHRQARTRKGWNAIEEQWAVLEALLTIFRSGLELGFRTCFILIVCEWSLICLDL